MLMSVSCSMAWVTFASPAQAEAACKLAGQDFNGRELKVEVATRDPTAPREPRERKPGKTLGQHGIAHYARFFNVFVQPLPTAARACHVTDVHAGV